MEVVIGSDLSKDELDALDQIGKGLKEGRPSACVARNAKRLAGLKYVQYAKNGSLTMTDKGKQTLFVKRCIDGLRAVSQEAAGSMAADVAGFLAKKGHIAARPAGEGFEITSKGRECLADIDAGGR
ncbi:MAG TPA: hypothetical protein VL528_03760 [Oxalicibacterium sp.]|jgi:hypothetical protein|nr:hypothetical protein [Oxalicibacterium sp.]